MSGALQRPWTQEEFFAWEGHCNGRFEFDGEQPVDMSGVPFNHAIMLQNLHGTLREHLRGSEWLVLGPVIGLATVRKAVRYPDALISRARPPGRAYLIPEVVMVFEILSPTSGRTDRIIKPREYAGVPSIRRYVILESAGVGATVLTRDAADRPWTATTLIDPAEMLALPELGITLPLAALYENVDFTDTPPES